MRDYENTQQTTHEYDILANTCQGVSISSLPNHRLPDVDHVSIDAEMFWSEPFDHCNITVHEVPGCMDPPLIEKGIRHRVGMSECAERRFAPFEQIWVKLACEETGGHHRLAHYYRPATSLNGTHAPAPAPAPARNGTHTPSRNGAMGRVAGVNTISHSRPMEKTWKRVSRGSMA